MDIEEKRFQLLMSEKEFADSQFGGFFDLQIKVLTFLGAVIVLLGWIYSDKPKALGESGIAVISLALVVIGCSVILQGIVLYGSALGSLEYKMTTLNEEFRAALSLPGPPFTALWSWRRSPTQPPVTLAMMALFAMHIVVDIVLICLAWRYGQKIDLICWAIAGTILYEVLTIWAEVLVVLALRKLMRRAPG